MTIFAQTITNPGAEAGDTSGWTFRGGDPFTVTTSLPHSGTYCFSVGNGFADASAWDQDITVDVSLEAAIDAGIAAIHASGWQKHTSESGYLYIKYYDGGMALLSEVDTVTTAPTSWTQDNIYSMIPATTRTIRIGSYNNTPGFASTSWWDDYALDISDEGQADYFEQLAPKSLQVATYAWASEPAEQLKNSQEAIYAYGASEGSSGLFKVKSHQVAVIAWVRGYVEQPHVRVWQFSLDGHDFYVLRLATLWTVCFDLTTGQWSEWFGHSLPYWRAHTGINWLGMGSTTADRLYGTNIVAGDDRAGILWMLDPTAGIDDGVATGEDPVSYNRSVTGIIPMRMRQSAPVGGVYVTASLGAPIITGAQITLEYSNDGGNSYVSAGSVTITSSDYTQEIAWRSLGLITAPGRIFRLTDNGASVRIAGADMK